MKKYNEKFSKILTGSAIVATFLSIGILYFLKKLLIELDDIDYS